MFDIFCCHPCLQHMLFYGMPINSLFSYKQTKNASFQAKVIEPPNWTSAVNVDHDLWESVIKETMFNMSRMASYSFQ